MLLWARDASPQADPGLNLESFAESDGTVTAIVPLPGDNSRLLIVLKEGRVLIRDATGLRTTPFLDMTGQLGTFPEEGLLGLAPFPTWASEPGFVVHYVDPAGNVKIAYMRRSATDPNRADPGSKNELLHIFHPTPNHNGGQLAFGPDGYLYIAVGDGGKFWDPDNEGQRLSTRLGKILRIQPRATGYSIPPSNPFYGGNGYWEIWAYGLRNPWRFSFDKLTGDLFIADVGQDFLEEIDFQPAGSAGGQNYGWRRMEGSRCVDPINPYLEPPPACDQTGLTLPIMEYGHETGCSVTGGYRYRGTAIPGLAGFYLFSDYCDGIIRVSRPDAQGRWVFAPVLDTRSFVTTFGQDNAGELYLGDAGGDVYKLKAGTPGVTTSDAGRIKEGDAGTREAVFSVFLVPSSTQAVTVNYATKDGTATAGSDYEPASGTLTFAPGATSATVTVPIRGDTAYEPDEAFTLELLSATNASVLDAGRVGKARILNDDAALSVADTSVYEGDAGTSDLTFTVTLTRPPGHTADVSVHYASIDGTAVAGSDFVAASGDLHFTDGAVSATIAVPVVGDLLVEPNETLSIALSDANGAAILDATATGTILNTDLGPLFYSENDPVVVEGDTGTVDVTFHVVLERPSEQTVSANYYLFDGSATGWGTNPDFVRRQGVLSFAPGETAHDLVFQVNGDTLDEDDEMFSLALTNVVNGRVRDNSGRATITDDDAPPVVTLVGNPVVTEGDDGWKAAEFTLHLSAPSGRTVKVPIQYTAGTATPAVPGALHIPPQTYGAGSLIFWAGRTSAPYPATISVPAITQPIRRIRVRLGASKTIESSLSPEVFAAMDVLLVAPNGRTVLLLSDVALDPGTTSGVFAFDDFGPEPAAGSTAGRYRPADFDPEGDSDDMPAPAPPGPYGTSLAALDGMPAGDWKVYVNRRDAWNGPVAYGGVTLEFEPDADSGATGGYTLHVPAGMTEVPLRGYVFGDLADEPDETFDLDIRTPENGTGTLGASIHGTATIVDDDEAMAVVDDVTVGTGSAATTASFQVRLASPSLSATSLHFATASGSAVAGTDYVAREGRVEFAPGASSAQVDVGVLAQATPGPDRRFQIVLDDPNGLTIVRSRATATLVTPLPRLSIADASVAEGDAGVRVLNLDVALSAPSSRTVTVGFMTVDGTAKAGSDYDAASGTLTFAPGDTRRTISVGIWGDTALESDETFEVALSNATLAELADASAGVHVVNDDASSQFQFGALTYPVVEGGKAAVAVNRSGTLTSPASVFYVVEAGSARASAPAQDFVPRSGTISFAAGQKTATLLVETLADTNNEPDEVILLRLTGAGPATVAATAEPSSAVVTIKNDDAGGSVRFTTNAVRVVETAGVVRLQVQRTGGTAGDSQVGYRTSPLTATGGATDYDDCVGVLSFAAAGPPAKHQTIEIPLRTDALAEGAESFYVSLEDPSTGVSLGQPSTVVVTIEDAASTLEFGAITYEVKEAAKVANVEVRRSGPAVPVSVAYFAGAPGDTATAGSDYRALSGTLTMKPRVSSATLSIPLLRDVTVEGIEDFTVTLENPLGATLGAARTTRVAILDDDAPPTVEFSTTEFAVGEGLGRAILTFVRRGRTDVALTAPIYARPEESTALHPADFRFEANGVTFPVGATTAGVPVTIVQDTADEGPEIAAFELGLPTCATDCGALLGPRKSARLTINDDETGVQFGVASYAVTEGSAVTVTLKRTGPLTRTTTLVYFAEPGSATDTGGDADYSLGSVNAVFAPRQKSLSFALTPRLDALLEGNETFTLKLGELEGAGQGSPAQATVTIRDRNRGGTLQFAATDFVALESDGGAVITVRRSDADTGPVTVRYSCGLPADGSSGASTYDFEAVSGTLTFAASETTRTFWVPVHSNGTPDPGVVVVTLRLDSPSLGSSLGATANARLWIVRD